MQTRSQYKLVFYLSNPVVENIAFPYVYYVIKRLHGIITQCKFRRCNIDKLNLTQQKFNDFSKAIIHGCSLLIFFNSNNLQLWSWKII